MKVVTKRLGQEPALQGAKILQQTISDLRGSELVPKGVYRFASFREADEWMLNEMVNTHARLRSRMSSEKPSFLRRFLATFSKG